MQQHRLFFYILQKTSFFSWNMIPTQKRTASAVPTSCLAASCSHRGKPPTTIGAEELNGRV
ncbi:hypothetical protein RG959_23305, partial [Domibacillus sp. 8LH]|uniref:hypothetical protein n=1 Tax=Domibacillus sp. 8LH TaxID=3073900 RepID=UPI00317CA1F2